jgi:hypothetical protein
VGRIQRCPFCVWADGKREKLQHGWVREPFLAAHLLFSICVRSSALVFDIAS